MVHRYCPQCGRQDSLRKRLGDWWYWHKMRVRTKNVSLIPSVYADIEKADNHKFRIKSRIKINSEGVLDEMCDYKGTIEEAESSDYPYSRRDGIELHLKDQAVNLGADIVIHEVDFPTPGIKRYRAQLYARPSNT